MHTVKTMRMLPAVILAIAAGMLSQGCRKQPANIIPTEKMAHVMADVYVGEAVMESSPQLFPTDSARRAFKQAIFARNGVTTAEVDTSLFWYGYNTEEYLKVCERTEEIIHERIAEAESKGAKAASTTRSMSIDGDSVNLWSGPSAIRNSLQNPTDYITFSIPRDKNWERGDRYTLSGKGILTHHPIEMVLAVDYNDGNTEYVTLRRDASERTQRLTLVLDSMKTATSVYGYVHYKPSDGEVSYLDSLSLVRTRGKNDNKKARANQLHTRYR